MHERIFPECRPDLKPMLKELKLDTYDIFEYLCRQHGVCSQNTLYVSRTPDKIIDSRAFDFPYDIPDFDTSSYGWL